jgi:glutamate:GABA antiporter
LNKKILGPFSLAMIAVVAIVDLRAIPLMSSYGLSAVFFYLLAACMFLIPSGLVCAELSTHLHKPGGMYAWVYESFGEGIGFMAIWLEWLNNVIGYPASLTFISVTLAYLYDPNLAQHKSYIVLSTLSILWLVTGFTMLGIRPSSRLNVLGATLGTLIPGALIIVLGLIWLILGKPLQIDLHWAKVLPNWKEINPGFFAAMILGFGGMQIVAFHTSNVQNPRRNYPIAIFAAIVIIFSVTLFTSLAISLVVPHDQLNLVSGLIDGFGRFFSYFNIPWATPLVIFMIIVSLVSTLNAWFLGPSRGLVVAAHKGILPKVFSYTNKQDAPVLILISQAIVVTLLSLVFLYSPDISSGFWILLNLSSQTALLVYMLIFAAGIKQRFMRKQENDSAYKIPGGKIGICLVAGTGIVTCLIALCTSFIPPAMVKMSSVWSYEMILVCSNVIFLGIPIIIYFSRRKVRSGIVFVDEADIALLNLTQ